MEQLVEALQRWEGKAAGRKNSIPAYKLYMIL
jgi:hypothetical protein